MKHVTEQCGQMMPIIRPVFTTLLKDGKTFVSAEIPGMDVADRPCFYAGKGRLKVSYVRVGDADQPMTEYEIYSYEAFRRKYQDDIRPIEQAALRMLQTDLLEQYLAKLKEGRPHLSQLNAEEIGELMGITRDGVPTMAAVQLFGLFPQAYFPQMCVTAVSVPGTEVGTLGPEGERFLDNRRIERTLSQMLEDTVSFVRRNIRIKTVIDPETGKRANREDYPPTAVREAILNALIHRDYLILGSEVHIDIYDDRLTISSPGGMADGTRIQERDITNISSTRRNPVLADVFARLGYMERQGSGFKKITETYYAAHNYRAELEPKFYSDGTSFQVTLYNLNYGQTTGETGLVDEKQAFDSEKTGLQIKKQAFESLLAGLGTSAPTKENILKLFQHFGFDTVFARTDVMRVAGITATPATELMRKMKAANLIESAKGRGKYMFVEPKE